MEKTIKKYGYLIVPVLIVIGIIAFLRKPEFFDNFGVGIFSYLAISSFYMINSKKHPKWIIYSYLIIGLIGLVVDGVIVLKTMG